MLRLSLQKTHAYAAQILEHTELVLQQLAALLALLQALRTVRVLLRHGYQLLLCPP